MENTNETSNEALVKAYEELKAQNEKLQQQQNMTQELLQQVSSQQTTAGQSAGASTSANTEQSQSATDGSTDSLSQDDIINSLYNRLKQEETAKKAEANLSSTMATLTSAFGSPEAAETALSEKAQQLGVSIDYLKQQAGVNPALVTSHFNKQPIGGNQTSNQTMTSGLNTATASETTTDYSALQSELNDQFYKAVTTPMFSKDSVSFKDLGDLIVRATNAHYKNSVN